MGLSIRGSSSNCAASCSASANGGGSGLSSPIILHAKHNDQHWQQSDADTIQKKQWSTDSCGLIPSRWRDLLSPQLKQPPPRDFAGVIQTSASVGTATTFRNEFRYECMKQFAAKGFLFLVW